jgi:hypothetical protein
MRDCGLQLWCSSDPAGCDSLQHKLLSADVQSADVYSAISWAAAAGLRRQTPVLLQCPSRVVQLAYPHAPPSRISGCEASPVCAHRHHTSAAVAGCALYVSICRPSDLRSWTGCTVRRSCHASAHTMHCRYVPAPLLLLLLLACCKAAAASACCNGQLHLGSIRWPTDLPFKQTQQLAALPNNTRISDTNTNTQVPHSWPVHSVQRYQCVDTVVAIRYARHVCGHLTTVLQDAKGKIRVYCRVRPLLEFEAAKHQVGPASHVVCTAKWGCCILSYRYLRCVHALPAICVPYV